MAHAFSDLFRVGAAIALLTFIAALLLKELPLKTAVGTSASEDEKAPSPPLLSRGDDAGRIAAAMGDPEAPLPR
jgi:hypothetical protein